MARTCTVCSHEQRDDIDLAIVSGQSQRAVSAAFRVGHDSIQRHAAKHLTSNLREAAERASRIRADDLVTAMVGVAQEAQEVLDRARNAENDRLALAAVREIRESVKALAALTPSPEDTEVLALMRALARVLTRHPGVAADLDAELRAEGQDNLAEVVRTVS